MPYRFNPFTNRFDLDNGVNVSLAGNTSGTLTLLSSGTMILAGGNNITLSQDGQTVTISGAAGGGAGYTAGMSNLGNTSGTTGVADRRLLIAGGNNITISQSLDAANSSGTITISAFNQTVESQSLGMSNLGNTSGTTGIASGGQVRFLFAGGNNVTLSQSLNGASGTITISAANETQTVPPIATAVKVAVSTVASTGTITRFSPEDHLHQGVNSAGISNIGNTSGTSGVGPGRMVLAGGNNITLSQATDATGSTVTISAAAGGAGGNFSGGMSNLGNTAGTSGTVSNQLVLVGSGGITISQSINGQSATASIIGGGNASWWQNAETQVANTFAAGSFFIFPLCPNGPFPMNMTASTFQLDFYGNFTATSQSSSHSITVSIGIYTTNNSTQLTLVNSASTSWSFSAATSNSANYNGGRFLTLNSSLFSTGLTFSRNGEYHIGFWSSTSNFAPTISIRQGGVFGAGGQRSGTIGVSVATAASMGLGPFTPAVYSATFSSAIPTALAKSDLIGTVLNQARGLVVQLNNIASSY